MISRYELIRRAIELEETDDPWMLDVIGSFDYLVDHYQQNQGKLSQTFTEFLESIDATSNSDLSAWIEDVNQGLDELSEDDRKNLTSYIEATTNELNREN